MTTLKRGVIHRISLPLAIASAQIVEIEMAGGAVALSVGCNSRNEPSLWALVGPDAAKERREFIVVWTGAGVSLSGVGRFLGTFVHRALVWHVFEGLKS